MITREDLTQLKKGVIVAGAMLISISGLSQSVNWKADTAKATIKFVTSGVFGEVNGSLSSLKATILFNEKDPASSYMKATVDPNTIETGITLRNKHLRSKEEFFNISKYPLISFISKQIQKTASGYTVTGYLTIKAVTKQVDIQFTFEKTSTGAIFKGHFTMDAVDYTVGTSSKSVTVYIEVPVTK
jgi:polyisoprenoid-binding protein YceI